MMSGEERRLIDEAVAAGRVKRLDVPSRKRAMRAGAGSARVDRVAALSLAPSSRVDADGRYLMSARELLEWAFGAENASLDFDEIATETGALPGVGMEWVLMERGRLGNVRIDGGGQSLPHPDADMVASAVAALPPRLGGRGMAVRLAEIARCGGAPDWMEGARPRCVPVQVRRNQNGAHAATEVIGRIEYVDRGRKRAREVRACPVTYSPTQSQINAARQGYEEWWGVLNEIRLTFQQYSGLTSIVVTDEMPAARPWEKKAA